MHKQTCKTYVTHWYPIYNAFDFMLMFPTKKFHVIWSAGFTKLPYNGEEYYVGPENQILAKIKSEVAIKEAIAETEVSEVEKEMLTDI